MKEPCYDHLNLLYDSTNAAQAIVSIESNLPLETVKSAWKRCDFHYMKISNKDIRLVEDVVRRIKINLPEMRNKNVEEVRSYFGIVQ